MVCLCADWCGVCRSYRSLFEAAAARHPGLRFAWVDIEGHAALIGDMDMATFPTLLVADHTGVAFHGPVTPHAGTLSRLLTALDTPGGTLQAHDDDSRQLLRLLADQPQLWVKA